MNEKILELLTEIKLDIKCIKERQERMEVQQEENTRILRSLKHSSEVNKAEHDNMINNINIIEGEIKGIRKDLSNVEMITASNWSDIAKLKAVK
ncbi:hypothetical protein [Tepidibacter formicigenes]|jgi:pyruvate-formate lyase-activating enzyme|uniref:Uncharacterized protein n=1 Tax=Tepidibacter formicigenes DSM 15518 TaxID=1123349 RepID=A0A1M6NZ32_9FIRM|nr:hypothetical protein [Tepidibacter formicigenes]SHK00882.1 hypothetical protein SAMN02744037_01404 [Tepidibacter formicigenes DSM 15518]